MNAFAKADAEKLAKRYLCSNKNEKAVRDYFDGFEELQKRIAQAEKKTREYQISKFGKVFPKISGHCWSGCPTRLVKPFYPQEAKHYRIFGQVMVNAVVDEDGKVIYAQTRKGNVLLRQAAFAAACQSSYNPLRFEDKPIKFQWVIVYNFVSN